MMRRLLAGSLAFVTILSVFICVTALVQERFAAADTPENTPTTSPTPCVIFMDMRTPEPTINPNAPTPPATPPTTPTPVLVISDYSADPQDIEVGALSAYYSPFDKLYWKFVLWCVEYNRSVSPCKKNGFYIYARSFSENAQDTNEFPFYSAKHPHSKAGAEIYRLNLIAADLFFDYVSSTLACGSAPVVPWDGVLLEFVPDKNGMNRSANVYNLNGKQLTLMDEETFNATLGREYARRINGQ